MSVSLDEKAEFSRLDQTQTFRQGGLERWRAAEVGIVGTGNVGQPAAFLAVQAGASVRLVDPDVGSAENAGTQRVRVGVPKVESVVAHCNAIRRGRAVGTQRDIRQVGVGELLGLRVLLDCSDDPALAIPLTRISNGLGIPLLRLAVDGSGQMEMGRVLCSHGGAGHSCQLCTYAIEDIFRHTQRTPCPNRDPARPATLAGGPLGTAIAAAGLLQAQRLVTGNDTQQVFDHELILDMSNWQLLPIQRRRSDKCLSGHERWRLTRLKRTASETNLAHLFHEATTRLDTRDVYLQPFGHPLCVEAICPCSSRQAAVGTRWAAPPHCPRCGTVMEWLRQAARTSLAPREAKELEIDRLPLTELGFPRAGALFTASGPGKPPLRLLLE